MSSVKGTNEKMVVTNAQESKAKKDEEVPFWAARVGEQQPLLAPQVWGCTYFSTV
jgi:hypothetical protein